MYLDFHYPFKKILLTTLLPHHLSCHILIKMNNLSNKLNMYSFIMDSYKFFGNILKVQYVMTIQHVFMQFTKCDYTM
jgi:hypothetical protein